MIVGSAAIHWLSRSLQPRLYRRLDPATAGTAGFVFRLLATLAVVVLALRIAGVNAGTLAVGGAFTAVLLGLAAQQSLGAIFAGVVLQSTRPFRVGERVRFVGGAVAGSVEGTVTSLGLFYTTLSQGADRLQIPNNVLLMLAVVPLREPEKVDVKVNLPRSRQPARSRTTPAAHDHRSDPLPAGSGARGDRRRPSRRAHLGDPPARRGRLPAGRRGAGGTAPPRHRRTRSRHLPVPRPPPGARRRAVVGEAAPLSRRARSPS